MIIVLDCNVLISAGISPQGTCRQVVDHVVRYHEWYFSRETALEFRSVMRYPHLKKYAKKFERIIYTMQAVGIEVDLTPISETLPDPDDVIYLQTARSANADSLITGNKKHFPLPHYGKIRILSPREFIDLKNNL